MYIVSNTFFQGTSLKLAVLFIKLKNITQIPWIYMNVGGFSQGGHLSLHAVLREDGIKGIY